MDGDDRAKAERTELVNRSRRPRRGGYQRTRAESAFGAAFGLPAAWLTVTRREGFASGSQEVFSPVIEKVS